MKRKLLFQLKLLYILLGITVYAKSQNTIDHPGIQINQPCPDFELANVDYYSKTNVSLRDFAGKPLILDFWTTGCTSCVQSFPKISRLKALFGENVQVLLIGVDFLRDARHSIARKSFNRYREKYQLDLPVAYDSNLFKLFQVPSVPYVVWIDKTGKIRGVSSSDQLTEQNIAALVNITGDESLQLVSPPNPISYDYHHPLLVNNNGGADSVFLFRSLLTKYEAGCPQFVQPFISSTNKTFGFVRSNRIQTTGVSLGELYDLAYGDTINRNPSFYTDNIDEKHDLFVSSYGKWWRSPILEIKDKSKFITHPSSPENKFNYSCIVPENLANTVLLQKIMQSDLEHYFGYQVKVETVLMPCWILTADKETKYRLRSKARSTGASSTPSSMSINNLPMYALIRLIFEYHSAEPPFIDETGILENIDLQVDAVMTSLDDIRAQLRLKGFELRKAERKMKVIVISDRKK